MTSSEKDRVRRILDDVSREMMGYSNPGYNVRATWKRKLEEVKDIVNYSIASDRL